MDCQNQSLNLLIQIKFDQFINHRSYQILYILIFDNYKIDKNKIYVKYKRIHLTPFLLLTFSPYYRTYPGLLYFIVKYKPTKIFTSIFFYFNFIVSDNLISNKHICNFIIFSDSQKAINQS